MSKTRSPRQRGAVRKSEAVLVTVWMPVDLLALIDRAVADNDTDRSKFVRGAVRKAVTK